MSYPYTQLRAAQGAEHYGVVFRDLQANEVRLELMGIIVNHLMLFLVLRINQA